MNDPGLLDYVTAIGSITTPLLVLALTTVAWMLRTRLERQAKLEAALREDRIQTYNAILEPFVILLMPEAAWQADPKNKRRDKDAIATQKMLSLEYRQIASKLSLVGADAVVKAYNNLMQYFFARGDESATPDDAREMSVSTQIDGISRPPDHVSRGKGVSAPRLA